MSFKATTTKNYTVFLDLLCTCCQTVEAVHHFRKNGCIWNAEWSWGGKPEEEDEYVKVKKQKWVYKERVRKNWFYLV